jgi:hypothetical protein
VPATPPPLNPSPSKTTQVSSPTDVHLEPSAKRKWLMVIVGAAVLGGLGGFLLPRRGGKPEAQPVPGPAIPIPAVPGVPEEGTLGKPEVATANPEDHGKPAVSHIEITVLPAESLLSLDDRTFGGNSIRMNVPRSRTFHLVQARAPGYVPFKRSISFASDVELTIKLSPQPEPAPERPTAAQAGAQPRVEVKTTPTVPAEDFGMTLQPPARRRPTVKMDESDPYVP